MNLVGEVTFICHLDYQPIERKVCILSFFDLPVNLTHKEVFTNVY